MGIYNDIVVMEKFMRKGRQEMDKNMDQVNGCGCGCNGNDEEIEVITLEFDDGESMECEVLGVFEFDKKEYIALLPKDGSDDVYIYGYKELDEEEFELVDITDEDEFKKVAEAFEKLAFEDE